MLSSFDLRTFVVDGLRQVVVTLACMVVGMSLTTVTSVHWAMLVALTLMFVLAMNMGRGRANRE